MNRHFPIGVSLGEPFMYDAAELLTWLTDSVSIVLDLFRPCIEIGSSPLPLSVIVEPK